MILGWINRDSSGLAYPTYNTYADLPLPTDYTGICVVLTATGLWPFNRKPAGMYSSDGLTWTYMSAYPELMKDGNLGIVNTSDNSKVIRFDASEITTGTTQTMIFPDRQLHLGQENIIKVRNETGSTIPIGSAVYPSGVSGGMVLISLASAASKETCRLVGVTCGSIANNTNGWVTKFGLCENIDTSSFVAGNILYLSNTAGGLTTTKPTGSSFITQIGAVKSVHATTGSIVVDINTTEFSVEASSVVGWSPSDTATIAFVDGTRTLTITPASGSFSFYQAGDKYNKATDSIQIDDTEGMWVVYYNNGTLQKVLAPTDAQVSSLIRNNPLVAYIYWNATDNKAEYVGKELHGIGMPADAHNYAHFAFGARYLNGLLPTDVLADQAGNSNTHAQFGIGAGAFADEDLYFSTSPIVSTTGLPIAYLAGTESSPTLRFTTNTGYSILTTGTGRMAFNTVSGGNWVLSESVNSDFVLCHILAINENASTKRIIAFVGQVNYATTTLAREGAPVELRNLKRAGILPQETVQLATFSFQTADAYTNAVNARIISIDADNDWIDWTGGAVSSPGSTVVVSSFSDADFELFDDADITKKAVFQLSGITSGATRTITVPDSNSTLLTDVSQTILGHKTFTGLAFTLHSAGASHPLIDFDYSTNMQFIGDGSIDSSAAIGAIVNFGCYRDGVGQVNVYNASSHAAASTDWVATCNDGTDLTRYVDMGINSSGWTGTGLGEGARKAYLMSKDVGLDVYADGAALRLGTSGAHDASILTTGIERFIVKADGKIGININAPTNYLHVDSPMNTNTINLGLEVSKGTGYFRAANGTSQVDQFLPVFFGKSTYTLSNTGLSFVALQGNSTDITTATIAFSARNAAGTSGVGATQRAWEFLNYTTPLVTILGDGKVGINTGVNAPTQALEVNGNIAMRKVGTAGSAPILAISGYGNDAAAHSYLQFLSSRGTSIGAAVQTQSNDILNTVDVFGVNSSNAIALCGRWWVVQDGAAGATYCPGRFEFYTVNAATGGALALTVDSSQKIIIAKDTLNIATQKTQASAGAAGVKGDICHDTNYIYVCTATNTWKRSAIATW